MRKQQLRAAGLDFLEFEPDLPRGDLPLVLGLHGRGASGEDLAGMTGWLSPEAYRFVTPNGPLPVENAPWEGGHAWYVIGQQQVSTIAHSRDLLLALVEELEERYATPRERIALVGFSQGAVMALDVGLRSVRPFGGLVAMSGYLHAPETFGPALRAGYDRRVLLLHGTYDEVMTVDGARLARDVLEAAGLEPEYHELPIGHQVTSNALALVRDFLERALRRAPSRIASPGLQVQGGVSPEPKLETGE
jgi:phospholipase/carboxylesterase